MKEKVAGHSILLLLGLAFLIIPNLSLASTPTFETSESTASVVAGTDDQQASTTPTVANVAQVKASRTLTVAALPANAETIVIGTCTITFTTVASSTSHDTNCTGGASIDRTATTTDTLLTPTEVANQLLLLTNVSDTGHGALAITSSSTSVTSAIFTTSGTESASTTITFTDGTSNDITSTNSRTGVVPVAQINTITITGTVDTGDIFTATLPTVGAVNYTVQSTDTTTTQIAAGLGAAILASSGYAGQAFTASNSTNTVILTAKVAGTGFTQTSSATNRGSAAQVVTFTPSNISANHTYTITINGNGYRYSQESSDTIQDIVEALQARVDGHSAVTCTENDVAVICTADSAGTTFTYSANVTTSRGSSGGSSSHGSSGNNNRTTTKVTTNVTPSSNPITPVAPVASVAMQGGASTIVRTLSFGTNGADVSLLQGLLAQDADIYPQGLTTGYFGPLTRAAVERFQIKYSIVSAGTPGYGWVGPRTKAKLVEIFGN